MRAALHQYLVGDLETYEVQYRFLRKDGTYMWILSKGKIVDRDAHGKPMRFVGTNTDITERRQMEENLRFTQFSFEKSAIGILHVDTDRRIFNANGYMAQMLGYSIEELCTKTTYDIDPFLSPEKRKPIWEKDTENAGYTFETVQIKKDGSHLPVEVTANLLENDSRQYAICFVKDISERKKDEEELRRLRSYLSNIINSMPSTLVAVDKDCKVTLWNNHTEQITGVRVEEARTQPLGNVFPRLAEKMDQVKDTLRERRVIRTPKVTHKVGGETRFEDITIFPLVANGMEGAVIRMDDVTDQVRLEDMMVQSERMLSLGGLAAGMAHEINNPLAGILQTAEVMKDRLRSSQVPANLKAAEEAGTTIDVIETYMEARSIFRMLTTIHEAGMRVSSIVNNMLSFARKSDSSVSIQNMENLIDQTLELATTDYDLKKQYDFKTVDIVKYYGTPSLIVPCQKSKIQQVLLNIFQNGTQAMQSSGTPSPCFIIRTGIELDGKMARIEIEDNGPGMDEKTRKRIFEPFFTTKPVGVGTGLGLSVSYFIITEDHGGEITVKSKPGTGTIFIIRLPLLKDSE